MAFPRAATPHRALRHAALAAALGGLLFFVYLLTYSGAPVTDDERIIIDTTDSFAMRGSVWLNQTSYLRPTQPTDVEPAQPLLSVPLYWLAYHTPWVGNVHTVMLFAPLVTALTAVVLFATALNLGYDERTALVAALLYGLTTIAWPYTKTYFREPLTTLMLFGAASLLVRWRQAFRVGDGRHWLWLAAGVGVTVAALLSKEAALLALPVLALLAYPGLGALRARGRQVVLATGAIAVLVMILALALIIFRAEFGVLATRYDPFRRLAAFTRDLSQAGGGIAGYLASPGKGIWWTSPVLVLALGAPLALPRRRWRESWLPLALTGLFVVFYAGVRGEQWTGGTGWGARYMVPLVPFLMVAALPLIDAMLKARRVWPRLVLASLALWGLVVQIGGSTVYLLDYYDHLSTSLPTPPWLGPAIWSFRWSQTFGTLLFLPQAETDIRWLIAGTDWLALAVIAAAILAAGGLVWRLARKPHAAPAQLLGVLVGVPLAIAIVALFALWRAYEDPRFRGGDEALAALRGYLDANARAGDTVLLTSPTYAYHFMNYYKGRATWYALPPSPGERFSPDSEPAALSHDPAALADPQAEDFRMTFSETGFFYNGRPIWLVGEQSASVPWAVRPVEWLYVARNYRVAAVEFGPAVRLVKLLPLTAPGPGRAPRRGPVVRFGADEMQLVGVDIVAADGTPLAGPLHPGDALGISLLWEAPRPPERGYTVAVYVMGPDGLPVLQQDSIPVGGFRPTTTWQAGERLRDNYGFILPGDFSPGTYEVWLVVYEWPSQQRLTAQQEGAAEQDHVVLGRIEVQASAGVSSP